MTDDKTTPFELLQCAKINFENFESAAPVFAQHPFYKFAKLQFDEALKATEGRNAGTEHG